MLDYILELIFPTKCGICGKICKEGLCKKCEIKISEHETNKTTKQNQMYFDETMHLYKYEGIIRQKIIEYKFQDKAYLYKTFSRMILKSKKICSNLKKYDIIIPVPIHKKRKLKRGYNQTELIANVIAKELELKTYKDVLIKSKDIMAQSELNKKDRKQNIKNAFIVKNEDKIKFKKIVLLDDIYTTGSTLEECSKTLKNAGVNEIGILTIAKD